MNIIGGKATLPTTALPQGADTIVVLYHDMRYTVYQDIRYTRAACF